MFYNILRSFNLKHVMKNKIKKFIRTKKDNFTGTRQKM